jgi:hypothetical protein
MKQAITLLLLATSFFSYGQSKHMIVNKSSIRKITKFKAKPKFGPDTSLANYYTGLSNPQLNAKLTELVNQSAEDFIFTASNSPSDKKFQDDIKTGLARFNPYFMELDTDDREKVCSYFVELMDCVGLKSSNGEINKWLYGFDTTKK